MKRIFTFLTGLLLSMNVLAATYGGVCALNLGGRCFPAADVTRFESNSDTAGTGGRVLYSANATANRGTSFRDRAGTNYVVASATTLNCPAAVIGTAAGAALGSYGISLGYSDAAVTYDTSSPGTNPVYMGGVSIQALVTNEKTSTFFINWSIPTGKYPFMYITGGGGSAMIYCKVD